MSEQKQVLEPWTEDPLHRLRRAVERRENVAVCGPPLFERIDLIDRLVKWIRPDARVIVLEGRVGENLNVNGDLLPANNLVVMHGIDTQGGASFEELFRSVASMRADYLVLPDVKLEHLDSYRANVARIPTPRLVGIDADANDPSIRSTSDVVVDVTSDRVQPLGIGGIWACPLPPRVGV